MTTELRTLFEETMREAENRDEKYFAHNGTRYEYDTMETAFLGFCIGLKKGLGMNMNQREAYQRGYAAAIRKKEQDNG